MKSYHEIGTMSKYLFMCTYVQVSSMQNSSKIYLCVYNKMNEKEIYKLNLHFFK